MAGLALAWLLADQRVTQVVVGPGRPEHLEPLREALAHPLTGAERATLESDVHDEPSCSSATTTWPAALPPEECIEAMAEVLTAHARGETHMPLRSMMRGARRRRVHGPDASLARGRPTEPVFALKAICMIPGNPARGLDAHQGTVTLFDGETGRPTAILNASAITAIRTAAVTAVATRLLARDGRARARDPRRRRAGPRAPGGARARARFEEIRIYAPTAAHAQALAERPAPGAAGQRASAPRRRSRGADVVVTATSAREPVLEPRWLKPGRPRQRGRRQHPDAREIDTATVAASALFCDSRESLATRRANSRSRSARARSPGRARPRRARRGPRRHARRGGGTPAR